MAKLKAAILQCDDVLDKFRGLYGNYPQMVVDAFHCVEPGIAFDVFDVRFGLYPENQHAYDFYVITGSKASVYDDEVWIRDLVKFVKLLDQRALSVFGICFGHQIMALANECEVRKANQGWGVGIASTQVTPEGKLFGLLQERLNIIVSHQDQVMSIPENAQLLSTNEFCPFFAVKWSESLLSIQGHPEWEKSYSKALMNDRRDRIPAHVIERGIMSLEKPLDNAGLIKLVLNYLIK